MRKVQCQSGCNEFYFKPSQCGENAVVLNENHAEAISDCCECRKRWLWLDGAPYTFTNWHLFEAPAADAYSELCGVISSGDVGLWKNDVCSQSNRYVCKRSSADGLEPVNFPPGKC